MGGEGEGRDAQIRHVDRQPADRLDGVHVEDGASRARDGRDVADGLNHAGLAVRHLHGYEHRPVAPAQVIVQPVEIDEPGRVDGERRHLIGREAMAGEHGGVLGGADQKALDGPSVPVQEGTGPEDHVVGLGAAAGEDHVVAAAADQPRDLATGGLEARARQASFPMDRRRVGESTCLHHRRQDLRSHRRGRVVVQIGALVIHPTQTGPGPTKSLQTRPPGVISNRVRGSAGSRQ